jgi:hypothetical protein
MSVWQQAVIDFAEGGDVEAAMCANAEGLVMRECPEVAPGSERFYELVYRGVMTAWRDRK